MSTEAEDFVPFKNTPCALLVQMMLSNYDDLMELDIGHQRIRNIRHAEGKYFVPVGSGSYEDIFRYSAENMIHPEDRELYLEFNDPRTLLERLKKSETPGVLRARYRHKLLNGDWCWVERVNVAGELHGIPEGVVYAFMYDVQDEMTNGAKKDDREALLTRNELTGLYMEEPFFRRGKEFLKEHTDGWCVVAIDLEHFKLFNEWYGRVQGDLLLAQIGAKMARVEQVTGGPVCYMGQDDFCMLVPYDKEKIRALYNDIHEMIMGHGTSVGFMPAFGISMADGESTIQELYDRAALAAHHAKDNYHTRIRLFEPSMYQQTEKDYQILSDFQKALREHELFFQLQPQCEISSKRIVGAESLVRWRKADGNLVSPGVFVPVLEQYGFVTDLDKYVWEAVCAWQKEWIDGGHTPLPISVNVSQIDIFAIDVPDYFGNLIMKYDLPVETIKIEITESAYVDNDLVVGSVRRLREMGFVVLMDDFGSGYSSLNMLRNLNVDIIKLDAQFLRMNGEDRKGLQIIETIVNMAKTMTVPIIVEGVETQEETDVLAGLGCRYVQGYYFYRPMPVEQFEELIAPPEHIDTGGFHYKVMDQFHAREFLDQNVFSDAMLNNILGPMAFYLWHGGDLDIVRYNQHFYRELGISDLDQYRNGFQERAPKEDKEKVYQLFERAMRNPLDGAVDDIRFVRPDGSMSWLHMRIFFLGEDENGMRFYGFVRDITQATKLSGEMRLLARLSPTTVVLMSRQGGEWSSNVVFHGLRDELGMSGEELEEELNDGRFYQRIEESERESLAALAISANTESRELSFRVSGAGGKPVPLRAEFDFVRDGESGVYYILTLRKSRV